jgi:hypothetical protein
MNAVLTIFERETTPDSNIHTRPLEVTGAENDVERIVRRILFAVPRGVEISTTQEAPYDDE